MDDRRISKMNFEETSSDKFMRKAKESPFMIMGILGFVTAVGIGAYKYKNRGGMSTSIYLMQLRVISQGTVVGALCGGIIYTLVTEHILKKD